MLLLFQDSSAASGLRLSDLFDPNPCNLIAVRVDGSSFKGKPVNDRDTVFAALCRI